MINIFESCTKIIVFYNQIKTLIGFLCRPGSNSKSLFDDKIFLSIELTKIRNFSHTNSLIQLIQLI